MNYQQHQIIFKSYQLFRQYGFKSVTMDDIARNIGVSKKTLYELFTDKDELVLEAVKFMLKDNQDKTDEVFASAKNAMEQIVGVLQLMEQMVRGLNMVCYIDLQKFYNTAYNYLQKHKQEYLYDCIVKNLQRGIHEGFYREDIDINIIAKYRMESALLVFQNNLFPQHEYDIVKVNYQIFAHFIYGISTLKGHKLFSKILNSLNSKK